MNRIYPSAKRRMLSTGVDWVGKDHVVALVDSTYSYSKDHETLADLDDPTHPFGSPVVTYTEAIPKRSLQSDGESIVCAGEWRVKVVDTTADAIIKYLILADTAGNLVAILEDLPNLPIMPAQLQAGQLYITSDPDVGGWLVI